MSTRRFLAPACVTALAVSGLITASPVLADCNSSGYSTVCAQGSVRGGDGGAVSGPVYPYPCDDDWMCAEGIDVVWNPGWDGPGGPGGPGRPGRPGRPG